MNAQHNPFDVLDELDLDNGNDGIAAPSYHTGKVEGRKKQKKRAHEAKKQAAAHEENLFVGVEELFGLGALEGGDDGGSKDKTKREKKRDRRRAKEMVKARGGLVLGDAGESFVVDEGGEGVGAEGAGLELEEDVVAVAGGIGGEGGGPGRALVRDLEGKGKRKEGKKEKRREKAARDSKNRYLDSLDPGMGMLEWEDGLRAAKKAGRVADQWAVVDAIEGDAFERDADKVYEFRVTKGKGVSVFALEDIEQGTMIMSEDPLLETPKNASLEAVARGFMRLSPGDQAIFLELSDGVSPGQQLAWKNKIDEAVRTVGAQDWGWGLDDSELFKILAIRQINGLKVGRGGDAVFLSISRINHSCLPNAHVFWNERLRRMVVHVTLDIVAGEEITANYLSDVEALLNREARRQKLENWWYFRCECVACDISAPFSVASERRRVEAAGLTEDFQNMQEQLEEVLLGDTEHNKEILEQKRRDLLTVVREQASVLEEEGLLGIELVRIYREAATLSAEIGNFGKAREWIETAAQLALICGGRDHEMFQICNNEFQEVHELCVAEKIVWEEAQDAKMRRRMEKRGILPQNSLVSTTCLTMEEEQAKEKEERLVEEREEQQLGKDEGHQCGAWVFTGICMQSQSGGWMSAPHAVSCYPGNGGFR